MKLDLHRESRGINLSRIAKYKKQEKRASCQKDLVIVWM